jgi:dipeptidyl aminopeptidase/acylaminoacyl peptidase
MPEELYGFEFTLEADPSFRSIALAVQSGYSADGVGTSGTPTNRDENGIIKAYALMGGKIISPLTIEISYVDIAHPWQITFDPADIMTDVPRSSTSFLDASLQIEKVIPIDDGYYLIGRTDWNDSRLSDVGIGGFDAKLLDANGTEYPIESASFDEIGITDVQPGEWAYKVYGKAFPASLTLKMTQANPQFIQPYSFTFDPGANPQLGQEWQINQTMEILGYQATIQSAKFIQQGDQRGFEFSVTADPALQGIPFNMESGITNGNSRGYGASPRDKNGVMKVYALSDGQYTGPILVTVRSAILESDWQTTWNPPAAEAGATPVYVPQACVTLDKWKQAIASPEALPSDFPQKVLLSRGAMSPDPSLFITSLDGSSDHGLVFGHGSLSRDGTKLVYNGADNGLRILDISSGKISTLTTSVNDSTPFWSPDGNQISFMRQTDKGINIFVMDANGQNARALTDTTDFLTLFGWMPDGQHLIFNAFRQDGTPIQLVDVASGNIETLITQPQSYNSSVSVSPDGAWIAYADKVIGKMYPGIFISRLDGSEKKLLMQLEGWATMASAWSADGKWLTINVIDAEQFQPITIPALVNVETCQVVPLMNLNGEIVEWIE